MTAVEQTARQEGRHGVQPGRQESAPRTPAGLIGRSARPAPAHRSAQGTHGTRDISSGQHESPGGERLAPPSRPNGVYQAGGKATIRYVAGTIDWELLHWLIRCPLLRMEDLATFCGVSVATMCRRLEATQAQGLIEHVRVAGLTRQGIERVYHLSNQGLHLLAAVLDADAAMLGRSWKTDEVRLLQRLPRIAHLVRVQAVIGGILTGAQISLGERGRRVRGTWHWVREYAHPFTSRLRERRVLLQVDAALALHVTAQSTGPSTAASGNAGRMRSAGAPGSPSSEWEAQDQWDRQDRWYAAFVLADAAVQDWAAGRRVLDTLLAYRECPERWGAYQSFPPVLVLAHSARHAERWLSLAREVGESHHVPDLVGAVALVPGPPAALEAVDPWRLTWRLLTTGQTTSLRSLLMPVPRAAVPPGLDQRGARALRVDPEQTIAIPRHAPRVILGHFDERADALASHAKTLNGTARNVGGMGQLYQASGKGEAAGTGCGPREASSLDGAQRAELRLLTVRLGGRLVELLDLLFRAPWIEAADVADLLGAPFASADRYLSALARHGLLLKESAGPASSDDYGAHAPVGQRAHLSFAPHSRLRLSPRGQQLVAAMHHIGIRSRLAQRAAPREPLALDRPFAKSAITRGKRDHTVGIYHFFARLACAATEEVARSATSARWRAAHGEKREQDQRKTPGVRPEVARLVWWETAPLCEDRYRHQGHWHNLRPDGAGVYEAGGRRLRFWLEWDCGSMNGADLARKFAAYATYVASGRWREVTSARGLPMLLIVVQGRGQMDRMQRVAAHVWGSLPTLSTRTTPPTYASHLTHLAVGVESASPVGARLSAFITLAHRLEEAGPLAGIWWPLLPAAFSPTHAMARESGSERRLSTVATSAPLEGPRYVFPRLLDDVPKMPADARRVTNVQGFGRTGHTA